MAASVTRPRHVPARTCIGCQEKNPKRRLVRIVRTPERRLRVDPTGRARGRGAYVCTRTECWEQALKGGTIAHALRFSPPADDLGALRAYAVGPHPEESET
ncbi:MAG TPA: YlxR family protein [Dehalococcoidia bacterium]|nr:YlxR family protein [Dehalococcoidia bacterium]